MKSQKEKMLGGELYDLSIVIIPSLFLFIHLLTSSVNS